MVSLHRQIAVQARKQNRDAWKEHDTMVTRVRDWPKVSGKDLQQALIQSLKTPK